MGTMGVSAHKMAVSRPVGHIIKYLCRILKTAVCFLGDIWQYKPTNFSFGDFFSFLDG